MSNLEEKFDRHKDAMTESMTEVKVKIAGIESDVGHISEKLDDHMSVIKEHVTGDNKIITHLEPILPYLTSMVEEQHFKTEKRRKRKEFLEIWKLHITFTLSLVTLSGIVWSFLS